MTAQTNKHITLPNTTNKLYGPCFLVKEIRTLQHYVQQENELEDALSKYCDQKIILTTTTLLAIETLTMMILPFVRDYERAKDEVELFVLESDWGTYRDSSNEPLIIRTQNNTFKISSVVNWVKYLLDVYIKHDTFKNFLDVELKTNKQTKLNF